MRSVDIISDRFNTGNLYPYLRSCKQIRSTILSSQAKFMKLKIPYSFLLLAGYLLNRVTVSSRQISPGESIRSMIVLFLCLGFIFLSIRLYVKDWHRANYLAFLVPMSLLVYQEVFRWIEREYTESSVIPGLILLACMALLIAALASPRLWAFIRQPAGLTNYLNLVFVIFLGFQAAQFVNEFQNIFRSRTESRTSAILPMSREIPLAPGDRPDIYLIILDGYAGQDVLRGIYQHDNSDFLTQLEQRGFYIAHDAHSNYVQTAYAVASLMNFDYVQPWQGSTSYYEYLVGPIQHNRVFEMLKKIGYQTVSFEGVTSYTQIVNSDVFYTDALPLNQFEMFLLADTPFEPLSHALELSVSIPDYDTHRLRTLDHLQKLESIPDTISGPTVTYLHLALPHPPFVFDEYGNATEPDRPFDIMDGNEFTGSREEYWKGYRRQVVFMNGRILQAIDSILEKSDTPPVIILLSDHGPGSMFRWDYEEPGCLWERTNILYALLLPDLQDDSVLHSNVTPVNTFRILFNTYFGTDIPLLEDRTYFATWHYPELIIDVTDDRDSRKSCNSDESPRSR